MINYYKEKYKKINKKTIELVRNAIINKKYFKQNDDNKKVILIEMLKNLNAIYKTQTQLKINEKNTLGYMLSGGGCYEPSSKTIHLFKLSLITFLHEFKHSLQLQKQKENSEIIARGYSISLFYLASPRHYERAVKKGLIFHEK